MKHYGIEIDEDLYDFDRTMDTSYILKVLKDEYSELNWDNSEISEHIITIIRKYLDTIDIQTTPKSTNELSKLKDLIYNVTKPVNSEKKSEYEAKNTIEFDDR